MFILQCYKKWLSPKTAVVFVPEKYSDDAAEKAGERPAILGFDEHDFGGRVRISLGSVKRPNEAAAKLFGALRELDERGETVALCEAVEATGIGLAVMNRMGRAAGFDIERV